MDCENCLNQIPYPKDAVYTEDNNHVFCDDDCREEWLQAEYAEMRRREGDE